MPVHRSYQIVSQFSLRKTLLFLMILFIYSTSVAQDFSPDLKWSVGLNALLVHNRVVDKRFSALPFRGNIPGVLATLSYKGDRSLQELNLNYIKGKQETDISPQVAINQFFFRTGYTYMYVIKSPELKRLGYGAGLTADISYNERNYKEFINADLSYEMTGSISALFQLIYTPGARLEGFRVSNRTSMPFITVLHQQAFGAEGSESDPLQNGFKWSKAFSNSSMANFSTYRRFSNRLTAEKMIRNGTYIGLAYQWEHYQIKSQHELISSSHRIEVSVTQHF